MVYNANKTKEQNQPHLEIDEIYTGVITNISDGKVVDFIPESAKDKWEGDLNAAAINVDVSVKLNDINDIYKFSQMFTYQTDDEGNLLYQTKGNLSNLSKYKKKYGQFPTVADKVKVFTKEGSNDAVFARIKLE